jgi:hypothetical protein
MRQSPDVAALLLVLLAAVNAQAQPAVPADTGRISGHVVTGYAELLRDASVTLVRVTDEGGRAESWTTKTDDNGAFVFTQLRVGRYRVRTSKAGYTNRQLPDPGTATEHLVPLDIGPAVELTTEGQAEDLQIVLRRSARIAGRIIRPDGSAAPDVQVQVAVRSGDGRVPLFDARATSQFDGRYEITELPPGEYFVGASNVPMPTRRGFDATQTTTEELKRAVAAAASSHWSWYPGVPESEPGNTVTVLEGVNAEGIDIWLTPSQRFSVSGRVFWPVGVSVDSINIDYGDPEGTRSGLWLVSDPGGLFTLSGIAPGALTMLVRAGSDQGMLMGIATTEVTVDSVEDVRIILDRPGLVAGRIVYEGNVPASSRATGIVAQQKLLKVSALYPVPESSLDSSGGFELHNIVGEYEFALEGLGPGLSITRVMRNGRALPMTRLGLAPGEVIRDLEIVVGR